MKTVEGKRTVFLGTPSFAVPCLEAVARVTRCVLVVTQPDRPTGRGRKIVRSPVKDKAIELGLEVAQPEKIRSQTFVQRIRSLKPDFLITAAYGKILGKKLLDVPARDCLNVHASLLPKYRGAAPINWAIINGERQTGVSIMRMAKELDSGAVYLKEPTTIGQNETAGELTARLAVIGAQALVETLENFDDLEPEEQKHTEATWAPMLQKSDGLIDWSEPATSIAQAVRGLHPWPCAWSYLAKVPLKIHAAVALEEDARSGVPGRIAGIGKEGIDVDCGRGILRILEVQAQGKKKMDVRQFQAGARLEVGQRLG